MTARVSIVVATRNAAHTLPRCLESIRRQSYPHRELIVMDAASTDGTVAILEAEPSVAYWESEPDRGIYHAWNKALVHATGEWVLFLGADDCFADDDALAALVAAAGSAPEADLIVARMAVVDAAGAVRGTVGTPWDWERMKRGQHIAHPGALHRRRLFEVHGGFDEGFRISGDYDFLLRLGPSARVSFLDRIVVRFGDGGVSSTQLNRRLAENLRIHAAHAEIGPWRARWTYLRTRLYYLKLRLRGARRGRGRT